MENPAGWGQAEHIIQSVMDKHEQLLREEPELCGLSLARTIADALVLAGLMSRDAAHKGVWEENPDAGTLCESCGKPAGIKPQFLGLSNSDYGWYCNLTCLIAKAITERALFTDGVGPL